MSTLSDHRRGYFGSRIGASELVTVDGTVHWSSALVVGARYAISCPEANVYVRQGGVGVQATSSNLLLVRGAYQLLNCDDTNSNRIAVTTADGMGGSLRITRIDPPTALAAHESQSYQSFIGSCARLTVDSGSYSQQLTIGARYMLLCLNSDVHLRQGSSAVTVGSSDFILYAGEPWYINADDTSSDYIAVTKYSGPDDELLILRVDSVA